MAALTPKSCQQSGRKEGPELMPAFVKGQNLSLRLSPVVCLYLIVFITTEEPSKESRGRCQSIIFKEIKT
jgi:hypothetical protein